MLCYSMLYGCVLSLSLYVCGVGLGVCFCLVSISCNISNIELCVSMYASFICILRMRQFPATFFTSPDDGEF
jgi:hypothetical protein